MNSSIKTAQSNTILNIAGVTFKLEKVFSQSLDKRFSNFCEKNKKVIKKVWYLSWYPSLKNKPPNLKKIKFFNQSVSIDSKERKIKYSFLKGKTSNPSFYNSRLLTYAYSQALIFNKGAFLHAAAVIKDSQAYLFFGLSGAGKSTVAKLSSRYKVLGDDIIAIRNFGGKFYAFATPWAQGSFIRPDRLLSARVEGIFFLNKARHISFKRVSQEEAFVRVFSHHTHFLEYTSMPLIKTLFLNCFDFINQVPAFEMEFTKTGNFWPDLEECLKRHKDTKSQGHKVTRSQGHKVTRSQSHKVI